MLLNLFYHGQNLKSGENYDFTTIEIIRLLRVNYFEKIWLPLLKACASIP